ncbi:hypothetical protein AUEXF2481DRAFT_362216 [Aureobasidium subglaciale EXF-2481]|uniref:Uncharacterized protein n=1 Tax=Aureobasidium subglaciale (strain EXF-2481) TaxID=1043005 RepID=A0A074YA17_AURSE|nr:uncharacterized protein AUEXF2481DRAFT_362216 [Aureobasidium subglaciale EXF-2481]KAI5217160.1 hypothetical protein E4T40_07541 [Aureobasidium subglaciale]KEQ92834.1 hypothetical protein AUEXF2481DRAFT_362216 [Aureobasidium subglaciale EXF-2481]
MCSPGLHNYRNVDELEHDRVIHVAGIGGLQVQNLTDEQKVALQGHMDERDSSPIEDPESQQPSPVSPALEPVRPNPAPASMLASTTSVTSSTTHALLCCDPLPLPRYPAYPDLTPRAIRELSGGPENVVYWMMKTFFKPSLKYKYRCLFVPFTRGGLEYLRDAIQDPRLSFYIEKVKFDGRHLEAITDVTNLSGQLALMDEILAILMTQSVSQRIPINRALSLLIASMKCLCLDKRDVMVT